jgi:hypothetical protein
MNLLRLPIAATVLALIFAVPAAAGDIQCGMTSQPSGQSTIGYVETGVSATDEITNSETATTDSIAESALYLTLSVLSLF